METGAGTTVAAFSDSDAAVMIGTPEGRPSFETIKCAGKKER
jgi:hypothetical protein